MKANRLMKKGLAHLLSITMIVGVMMAGLVLFGPFKTQEAHAAYSASPASITVLDPELSDGKVTNAHEVTFAGKKWLVLGYDGVGDPYSEGATKITLLAKDCLLTNAYFSSDQFNNEYSSSILKTQLENYVANTTNFTPAEQAAIITRTLEGGSNVADKAVDYVSGDSVDAKLWPLSSSEANMLSLGIVALESEYWLRSPGYKASYFDYYTAAYVWSASNTNHHGVNASGYNVSSHAIGVRPALQLDLTKAVFSPANQSFTAKSDFSAYYPAETDDADALANKQVSFNGLKWYIIPDSGASAINGTVTLFAADPIGASVFGTSNTYRGSTVQSYLDAQTASGGGFACMADAIKSVYLTDVGVTDAKLYNLSVAEANDLPRRVRFCATNDHWWLRDAGGYEDKAAAVNGWSDPANGGYVDGYGITITDKHNVRPALQLDLNEVTFSSDSKAFTFDNLDHSLEAHAATNATCTAPGNSAYWSCSKCGKFFSDEACETEIEADSWVIPATGHNMTDHPAVAATCTAAGNSAYWSCDQCNNFFSDENGDTAIDENSWVIPAIGHNMTDHPAVAATCTAAGNSAYWSCDQCNNFFSDENGDTAIDEYSWVIPAIGHDYYDSWTSDDDHHWHACTHGPCDSKDSYGAHEWKESVTRQPTCKAAGLKTYTCTVCGEEKTAPISKTAHNYGAWTTTRAATELSSGEQRRICSACGAYETRQLAQLAPTLPAVKIAKPKAAKKSATVKWKKVSKGNLKKIKKVEIQYSLDSKFQTGVKTKYANPKKTSVKIKGLKSKKKTYIRLRAYTNTGGVIHVSNWSGIKSAKAK